MARRCMVVVVCTICVSMFAHMGDKIQLSQCEDHRRGVRCVWRKKKKRTRNDPADPIRGEWRLLGERGRGCMQPYRACVKELKANDAITPQVKQKRKEKKNGLNSEVQYPVKREDFNKKKVHFLFDREGGEGLGREAELIRKGVPCESHVLRCASHASMPASPIWLRGSTGLSV